MHTILSKLITQTQATDTSWPNNSQHNRAFEISLAVLVLHHSTLVDFNMKATNKQTKRLTISRRDSIFVGLY